MDLSYILNELGEDRELYFNAIAPPIIQTSNFTFPSVAAMRADLQQEHARYFYTRGNNPTVNILRKKIAALEEAEDALALASGSAAIACAVLANVNQGDHIVSVANPYSWTKRLMNDFLPRFGVTTTFVDGTDPQHFARAIQPNTRVIYLESPNSFTFALQDLRAVATIAKGAGILTMIDNSHCSPLYQKPLDFGIDISLHTASKYFGGHSDVVAGLICGTSAMIQKIFYSEYMTLGGIISPMNAWLILRGLRTLPLRLAHVDQSARQLAQFLEGHPAIRRVYHPLLESHPQHELARQQMNGAGGLLTIALNTDTMATVDAFADALKRFLLGVSWGGHESLVFPASVGFATEPAATGIANERTEGFNLTRLYCGLDDVTVLKHDLIQALDSVK